MSEQDSGALAVGRVVKPHGIRGELVVEVLTDSPELRFAPGSVLDLQWRTGTPGARRITVAAARPHAGRLLLRAEEVDGRDAAEDVRGAVLTVSADVLEPIEDPDEFHDRDLEGLRVLTTTGEQVGVVRDVVHTPAGELLAVDAGEQREVLVPFVGEIVPEVDVPGGHLVVDPPEGLLDPS
ncbi:ribosome maturation factor RimM [Saccharopolyspora sp. HNM0983]|uniref:Ribosome maturation factor RimM n=1 Tax=Saccharopolyspora montiporae TaxID=2781240 RepID=A0A929B9M9_9PSEU|nr:ribosome maturation factor RimM [Saccharopolyspora sp. HNM0983]MBE9374380.1 ribosome maturation factor RimM [Saccharopolyspora sp. HNM0983]